MVILILLLTTGCELPAGLVPQAPTASISEAEIATLSALATQVNKTPDGILRLPTPTVTTEAVAPQGGEVNATSQPASIVITSITEKAAGQALISWQAEGDAPSGFKVVWTEAQGMPTFPENSSVAASSPDARSAQISITPGTIYYVRVCRYLYGACDVYSDLGIFAFLPGTPTPNLSSNATGTAAAKTKTPIAGLLKTGTPDSGLLITLMKGGTDGKAYMSWTASAPDTYGFKIIYSKTRTTPIYGTDPYFLIKDPKARSAYVDGASATKYYYRICRMTSTGSCGAYSPTYTYTFPKVNTPTPDPAVIAISGITDTATGAAQVAWTATGSFPSGFKILYSKTTALPTLSDSVVVISDGTLRLGTISGDPSGTYHVRVCKYYSGACVAYSPVVDFTFAADPATITITGVLDYGGAGGIEVTWDATGTFTNGFKILYSTSQSTPTLENASNVLVSDGTLRFGVVPGNADTSYYVRVCKFSGSGCGVYSNTVQFITKTAGISLSSDNANPPTLTWSVSGDNADGYQLFWVEDTTAPTWPTGSQYLESDPTARSYINAALASGNSYVVRLCLWNIAGSTCGDYSNTVEVTVP
jgi:hypothetical protein